MQNEICDSQFAIWRILLQRIKRTDSELTSSRIFCNIGALRLGTPPPCHLGEKEGIR